MTAMEKMFQTSTPIGVREKLIPPPPRRLWGHDSVTEQLYHNKWIKYRNSMEEKDKSWSELDAPRFVDFHDIPEVGDSYFEHADEQKFETPRRTLEKRLPTSEENNNVIETFERCCLSAIMEPTDDDRNVPIEKPVKIDEAVDSMFNCKESANKICSSKIVYNDDLEGKNDAVPDAFDFRVSIDGTEKQQSGKTKIEKKNLSDSRHCTIVEPFSFEVREKCKQEHKQARRERDSIGKETWTGFRANPVPNFVKTRAKKCESTKSELPKKNPYDVDMAKLCNAAETWKKKGFQPSLPKRMAVRPKAPDLRTAIRARERQRFEEQLRERERQREAIRLMEEAEKKKREDEEIARLRKELVHKAQPIRRYKIVVPRVAKRPLAEATTPLNIKRQKKN